MSGSLTLVDRVQEYLAHRRALGFSLKIAGTQLLQFARFADRRRHRGPLTTSLILEWACLPKNATPRYRAERLSIVRGFAGYLAGQDGQSQVPGRHLLGRNHDRRQPHIYTDRQLRQLVLAAGQLAPVYPLRPHAYSALFGLLASTGLRVSEALSLRLEHVDLSQGILFVEQTKFRKSRLVPLHLTVVVALRHYSALRAKQPVAMRSAAFFIGANGLRLPYTTVRHTFRRISNQLSWRSNGSLPLPRIHDLRHTFACRRLLLWHQQGVDVDRCIVALSTYLGHGKVSDTYWYLTGTPQLLTTVGTRFEQFVQTSRRLDHDAI